MIEKLARETCETDFRKLLCVRHRRVSALRDEHVERRNATTPQNFISNWKQKISVVVSCFVGNNGEHTFVAFNNTKSLLDNFRDFNH